MGEAAESDEMAELSLRPRSAKTMIAVVLVCSEGCYVIHSRVTLDLFKMVRRQESSR